MSATVTWSQPPTEGEVWPEMNFIDIGDPVLATEIARRWNKFPHLPDDVTFDPVREILKVGETEFSLAFLRFFCKHNDGKVFKINYNETDGLMIERVA